MKGALTTIMEYGGFSCCNELHTPRPNQLVPAHYGPDIYKDFEDCKNLKAQMGPRKVR